jgi:NADH:ubiquinone oxidoreductase subunit 3 (subunit A)
MKISPKPLLLLAATLGLAACESTREGLFGPSAPPAGSQGFVRGFLGGVASEEPSASAVARAVLSAGGTAGDAAAAAGFMLSVTLPSRAGLGGGGACVVYHPRRDAPEALIFMPGARQGGTATADRPAAVPMMARGLFALTTRMQGARPFEELIAPAEQMARFGAPASRALVADLAVVGGALLVARQKPNPEKLSAYECGFEPFDDTRRRFDVRFYLVAILFILFDLEIAFLFPWAVALKDIGAVGFWSMMIFLGILVVGFVYEWKKGALDWE